MASDTAKANSAKSAAARRAGSARVRHRHLLPAEAHGKAPKRDAIVHCGWGKLILAHTFADAQSLAAKVAARTSHEKTRHESQQQAQALPR